MKSKITPLKFPLFCLTLLLFNFNYAQISFTAESLTTFDDDNNKSCVVDMDGDFLDDIVRVSDTDINILFQQSDGSLKEQGFTPSTVIQNGGSPSWSISAGDVDGDGYNDLFLGGVTRATFLYNNGGASFTTDNHPEYIFCQRSTFADIDNDGDLDTFVCHDVDESHPYRNDGNRNMVLDQNLIDTADRPGNYAAIWVDYDNDRDIDLYITKCKQGSSPGDIDRTNLMYRNNGNGTFTEVAGALGIDDNAQSWATIFDDLDNDGDMDMFIVNHDQSNRYFRNNLVEDQATDPDAEVTFTNIIGSTGIAAGDLGSWENVAADFDNDGDLDIFSQLSNELYVNNGNNSFTGQNLSFNQGAIGDVDNDGDLDIVRRGTLYRNNNTTNDWIKVNITGMQSNKNGIGARIEATGSFGKQIREVRSGQGFHHMSSLTTHFGFDASSSRATVDKITIYWPSGAMDIIDNPALNTTVSVTEGETLSLQDTLTEDLIIYPNPTRESINIRSTIPLEDAIYSVFDITGKRVLNAKLSSNTVNVSKLNAGNYILRLISDGKIKTQKFIKQ